MFAVECSDRSSNLFCSFYYRNALCLYCCLFVNCKDIVLGCSLVPPDLSAHCEYWAAGYSIFIVWNKPDGLWTAVEVNVTGQTHKVGEAGEQDIKLSGFLPARTYEVSLTSISGTVRSSEPFMFSCSTDPRGESKRLYEFIEIQFQDDS